MSIFVNLKINEKVKNQLFNIKNNIEKETQKESSYAKILQILIDLYYKQKKEEQNGTKSK